MEITNIILHCSDSTWGSARDIRKWHMAKGWRDIGYHLIIQNSHLVGGLRLDTLDGHIECGRHLDGDMFITGDEVGAHALGYNKQSIGICLIGKRDFTYKQMRSLQALVLELCEKFDIPFAGVKGHYEIEKSGGKTCPNFDVGKFRDNLQWHMQREDWKGKK